VFVWGRRLFGLGIALIATLLLAANPYHLWYSQEAKMYALVVVAAMLDLWVFVMAVERGGWWRWALWFVLTSITFYIHVMTILLVPLQIAWLLINPRWRPRWRSYAVAVLLLFLPYVPLVWWQWKLFVDPNFSTGHRFVPLAEVLQRLVQSQIQGIPPRPHALLYAAPIFLLLAALFLSQKFRLARRLTLVWWFLPALGIFFISLQTPIFLDRYLIFTLPALLLLLAAGAWLVAEENRWIAISLVVLLLAFQLWQGWQQTTRPWKADFRAAAAYVAPHRQADDLTLFLIPYIRFNYQYYDPPPYAWAEAPYANRDSDIEQLPDRLASIVDGYDGVWLVESEEAFYDRNGLIRSWLDEHGDVTDEKQFALVRVTHYALD